MLCLASLGMIPHGVRPSAPGAPLSPDSLHSIGVESFVAAENWDLLDKRLRDQEAIKGISMMERQAGDSGHVIQVDCQEGDTVQREVVREEFPEGLGQWQLAEAVLDCDLPEARDTRKDVVLGILDDSACPFGEMGISHQEPQQAVGVQEESQEVSSWKSSSGASKSSAMVMSPLALPNRRCGLS